MLFIDKIIVKYITYSIKSRFMIQKAPSLTEIEVT